MAAPTSMHEVYLLLIHIYLLHIWMLWTTAVTELVEVQGLEVKRPTPAALHLFANSSAHLFMLVDFCLNGNRSNKKAVIVLG